MALNSPHSCSTYPKCTGLQIKHTSYVTSPPTKTKFSQNNRKLVSLGVNWWNWLKHFLLMGYLLFLYLCLLHQEIRPKCPIGPWKYLRSYRWCLTALHKVVNVVWRRQRTVCRFGDLYFTCSKSQSDTKAARNRCQIARQQASKGHAQPFYGFMGFIAHADGLRTQANRTLIEHLDKTKGP